MRSSNVRAIILGLAFTGLALSVASTPARADNDDWRRGHDHGRYDRDRERHEREWRDQERREHGYVYAPPPVYYAPPPATPALNFVFPLNIR
jgi:hypothetical protein